MANAASISVCYVVTAEGASTYASMMSISRQALRRIHPDAEVTLLTTKASAKAIEEQLGPLDHLVTRVVTPDLPSGLSPMLASRYLKTQMRRFIDGRFVFLDTDTLPLRPFLSDFDFNAFDVAAAEDVSEGFPYPHFHPAVRNTFEQLGWPHPPAHYLNSGVMAWNDTPAAVTLGEKWYDLWRQTSTLGVNVDQPALNRAVDLLDIRLSVLQRAYNAIPGASPWFVRGAKILHFYTKNGWPGQDTVLRELLEHFEQTGDIDWGRIKAARQGRVWTRRQPIRHWLRGIPAVRRSWHRLRGVQCQLRKWKAIHGD